MATASSDPLRVKKRRRSSHLHTMACCALDETAGKDGDHDVKSTLLLQEGENWLVCSFSHGQPPISCIVDDSLNQIMGATTGHPFHFSKALDIGNIKLFNDIHAPSKQDDDRMGFALLCIDIDGEYVALKDVRQKQMQAANKESETAPDNIEFFICRKRNKSQTGTKNADQANAVDAHGKDVDGHKNYSSDESTSGWTEDAEEITEACSLARLPPPKRESDQDDNGRFIYGYPEPLPRRQLRVLNNGDRILLCYPSETGVSLMKFEYVCGHQDHLFLEQRGTGNKNHASALEIQPPSLFNKSSEKKQSILHCTSVAEVSATNGHDNSSKKRVKSQSNNLSELETMKVDGTNMYKSDVNDDETDLSRKHHVDDNGNDDDKVVEKDSYISREGGVAMKDQDHAPTIPDIKVTNVALEQKEDGGAQDTMVSKCKVAISTSAGETRNTTTSDDNVGTGVLFEEDTVRESEQEEIQTAPFFTAPDQEDESVDDDMSGEELLSPVKSPSKEVESVQHAVQFESDVLGARGAAADEKDGEDGDGSFTDYSLTQPFPVPRSASERNRSSSSSSMCEDDDESTVCLEAESVQPEPEPEDSKLPPIDDKSEDEEEDDVYNEPTQPFQYAPKSLESCNQSEDVYQAETQFEMITSSKKEPNRCVENETKTISVIDNRGQLGITNQDIAEESEPAEMNLAQEENTSEVSEMGRDVATSEDPDDNTKKTSTNDSEHENHCNDNELDPLIMNETAISGPVREIVANIDTELVAPKSDDTEETLCQIGDANDNITDVDRPDRAPTERKKRESRNMAGAEISVSATPRQRPSRKRGTPTSERHTNNKEAVRVMFTGLAPTKKHKQMVNDIGAVLIDSIDDANTATHIIATDGKTTLRRTPKLMICFCKTSNILSIEWLEQCAKEQKLLGTDDFILLSDKEAEKTYNFSLSDSLRNGALVREERGGVLGGWQVYICSGVAGNRAPPAKELKLIIEAAGATILRSISGKNVHDPAKTIIITSDPANDKQLKEAKKVTAMGAHIHTTTWLFQVMITQSLVEEEKCSKKRKLVSPPSSGKRKSTRRK